MDFDKLSKRKTAPIVLFIALASSADVMARQDPGSSAQAPRLHVELSVREDGTATGVWAAGTAIAIGEEAANKAVREKIPLSRDAAVWLEVIEAAIPHAETRCAELAEMLDIPAFDATVVVGNRASSDGFGWVPNFVGINVEAFAQTYGPPSDGAVDRATRIIAHEYLHLLTYASYPNHRELRSTPFDRALWTIFFEGIGDYVSVSSRWYPDKQGRYSQVTAETLERLEPIFVDRLERLVTAAESEERDLRSGIAMGKFDEKWGSLTFALWLHSEVRRCGEGSALRKVFRLERASVLPLAERYAGASLKPRINDLRKQFGDAKTATDQIIPGCLAPASPPLEDDE